MKALQVISNNDLLHTVIHQAQDNERSRKHCIILCSPLTNEQGLCYRAIRQLALRLCKQGFDVIRFDYFACGNSCGSSEQLSVNKCVQNILDIRKFVIQYTKNQSFSYIGLRFGALLAALASVENQPSNLILWDPIIDGSSYLSYLEKMNNAFLAQNNRPSNQIHTEYLGYPYSDSLISEIGEKQLGAVNIPISTRVAILSSPGNSDQEQYIQESRLGGLNIDCASAQEWPYYPDDISSLDESYVAGQSINEICNIMRMRK